MGRHSPGVLETFGLLGTTSRKCSFNFSCYPLFQGDYSIYILFLHAFVSFDAMSKLSNNAEFQRSSNEDNAESEQREENEADLPKHGPFHCNSEYGMKFCSLEYYLDANPTDRLPRYASVRHFDPWIPEVNPTHPRANTLSVKTARRRTMLILQAVITSVFAAVSLGLMGWFITKYKPVGDVGTFMTGSCSTVHRWDAIWHIILNIVSTLLLGTGNYCMQVLVAPSRAEVDKAHGEGYSLDVGIHSYRHVWRISSKRRAIWFALGVISTLMHLL